MLGGSADFFSLPLTNRFRLWTNVLVPSTGCPIGAGHMESGWKFLTPVPGMGLIGSRYYLKSMIVGIYTARNSLSVITIWSTETTTAEVSRRHKCNCKDGNKYLCMASGRPRYQGIPTMARAVVLLGH